MIAPPAEDDGIEAVRQNAGDQHLALPTVEKPTDQVLDQAAPRVWSRPNIKRIRTC